MPVLEIKLLILLLVANGAPVATRFFLGSHLDYPLDCHSNFLDGHPLLGPSKTVRGVLAAVIATAFAASILNIPWQYGASIGGFAMCGDLLSSFIKRRIGLPSSSTVLGLDHIPEALLPLWINQHNLGIGWAEIFFVVIAFFVLERVLSHVLFKFKLRKQPH